MNIEEAIKILKQEPDFSLNYYNRENAIDVLLTAYEKQSKEIEELKEDNKHQWEERCKLTFELENSTINDKIKAKIEELDIDGYLNIKDVPKWQKEDMQKQVFLKEKEKINELIRVVNELRRDKNNE